MKPSVSKRLLDLNDTQYENKIKIEDNRKKFILLFSVLPVAPHILPFVFVSHPDRQLNDSAEVNAALLMHSSSRFGARSSSQRVVKSRYHIEVFHNYFLLVNSLLRFIQFGLTLASPANRRRKDRSQHQNGG